MNTVSQVILECLADSTITEEEKNILTVLKMSIMTVQDKELGLLWEITGLARGCHRELYLILQPLACCRNWKSYEQILICKLTEYFDKFKIPETRLQIFYKD